MKTQEFVIPYYIFLFLLNQIEFFVETGFLHVGQAGLELCLPQPPKALGLQA